MCKAMEDLRNESIREGIEKGRIEGRLLTLIDLVKDGTLTIEKAASQSKMTVEQFEETMERTLKS